MLVKLLYLAAIVLLGVLSFLAWKLVDFVGHLKNTLHRLDENLEGIQKTLNRVSEDLAPVFSSSQKTLDELARTNVKLQRLLEEAATLPPSLRELISGIERDLRDLTAGLRETLEKASLLINTGNERLSKEVADIFQEIEGLFERINAILDDIQGKIARTESLFKAIEETGQTTRTVAEIISQNIARSVIEVAAVMKGIETTVKVLKKRLTAGGETDV